MLRLSLLLALSVCLHLMAGSFLLRPVVDGSAALRALPAEQSPAVLQVRLAAAYAQPPSVAVAPPPAPPQVARMRTKPSIKPISSVAKASAPKPASQGSASAASTAAVAPSAPAMAASQAPASAAPAAPLEVYSRQPAFRLPPQQPRYPSQARRRNQQGVVLLEVRLDERGKQREISLMRSSGFPSLDQAALEAVAAWRFHPETINGKGVPSRVQIPIEFALLASR